MLTELIIWTELVALNQRLKFEVEGDYFWDLERILDMMKKTIKVDPKLLENYERL